MTIAGTERFHEMAEGLDARSPDAILHLLFDAQVAAAKAVEPAIPSIAIAADLVAETIRADGRLAYAAAGSSGLMALADALELPGTYGIARDRILILLAGGAAALDDIPGPSEDDDAQAISDVRKAGLSAKDCLIGVSASGTTAYTIAALKEARAAGARTIAIANNEDAPVFDGADVAILLKTPPEMIAGSTRMGAATAQKIVLNMLSTLMAVRLGHVHDGHMVNLRADNSKLRERAARMVAQIGGRGMDDARGLLGEADGSVKIAVMLAAGAPDRKVAEGLLESAGWRLRPALAMIEADDRPRRHGN